MADYFFPPQANNANFRSSSFVHFACIPEPKNGNVLHNIILPLPQGFTVTDGINYGSVDLGSIDLDKIAGSGRDWKTVAGDLFDQSLATAAQSIEKIARTTAGGAAGLATRQIQNPRTHTAFEGVSLRDFSFSFDLIPRESDEAIEIRNIRNIFQEFSYPDLDRDTAASAFRGLLQYPAIWKVKIIFRQTIGGRVNNFIPQILDEAYITNVTQVINPGANTYHKEGEPYAINLSIGLREARALTREDIKQLQF